LGSNPTLLYKYGAQDPSQARFIPFDNLIILSDTLSIPFFDEFYENRQRPVTFPQLSDIQDSGLSTGTCLAANGIATDVRNYMNSQSWNYTFNTSTNSVDSTPKSPIVVRIYNTSSTCFTGNNTITVWPTYYTYQFDTATGAKVDSFAVDADTILQVRMLYFVNADPDWLWLDDRAYVNSTYPINPRSYGVATMDGLNEYGQPYNKNNPTTYGDADLLTSKPINLGGLVSSDSLFFSFIFQPKGIGDYPNERDSLVVEFVDQFTGDWKVVWSTPGFEHPDSFTTSWRTVIFQVPLRLGPGDPQFYFNGTQFRFRNKASLAGNNDHWHIDYVRLDTGRSSRDTILGDIAFMYDFPPITLRYSEMPWKHFRPLVDLDTGATPVFFFGTTINNPSIDYNSKIDLWPGVNLYNFSGSANWPRYQPTNVDIFPDTDFNPIPGINTDSVTVAGEFFFSETGLGTGQYVFNDTLRSLQIFHKTMAYDDGSAERAYGLQGVGTKSFAYEFELTEPDTLAAVLMHFTHIDNDVNDLIFNINIWRSLEVGSNNDSMVESLDLKRPQYTDVLNGFSVYRLDTFLILDTGKYYVGWTQTDNRNIQLGWDMNSTKGRPHMYLKLNGIWQASSIQLDGSPMIRLLLDGEFDGNSTAIRPGPSRDAYGQMILFPNPSNGELNFRLADGKQAEIVRVIDMFGQTVMEAQDPGQSIHLNHLPAGMYFLHVSDFENNLYLNRFILAD
jgi:hypothetical protein